MMKVFSFLSFFFLSFFFFSFFFFLYLFIWILLSVVKRYYKVPAWNPSKPKYPYVLEVIKEGVVIDHIDISKKGFYLMGRLPLCDVTTGSANVSRVHAAVQHTPDGRVLLMDLGSTQGSHLNRKRLYPKKYTFFYTNDVFQMLGSRNFYILQGGPEREEFANLKQQVNDNLSDSSEYGQCSKKIISYFILFYFILFYFILFYFL